ncbi:MAG: dTDP-4-dehydrorhamnose reductase [Saprospiraceae bacterium]|nr:dTDP-4-dehydrorhamnose reductase [Saprospiraceae bacterium]MDP4998008.1 dTDP-4-dehydrorhamnose reductase [Saprospiraceae bacterium]
MIRILVTGAKGQLGQSFQQLSTAYPQWHFRFLDRATLDICDPKAVQHVFSEGNYNYCINCAAYTAVDKAESEPTAAFSINRDATALLAAACRKFNCFFIHFSTDYVYAPQANVPLRENGAVLPTGVYGNSKRAGEIHALWHCPDTLILRTSWVYSEFGNNFLKTMLRLADQRESVQVVYDQVGTPTYAPDLAAAVLHILEGAEKGAFGKKELRGIYNYSNEGVCSWFDFAHAIFDQSGKSCRTVPIRSAAFPTAAIRPPYSVLDKAKIRQTFGLEIPYWRESLENCLKKL